MIKKIIKKYLPQGRLALRFYSGLYYFSLWGMNFNQYENLNSNGEKWVLNYIKNQLKTNNPILFDVGANKGDYSEILAQSFSTKALIYSFEPVAETFHQLKKNTSKYSNTLHFNIGLSSTNGERDIIYQKGYNSQASFVKVDLHERISETIILRTLDSFCDEHNIDKIDFLKIDVEGFELKVIKGALNLIKNGKIHFIQFEFGGTQIYARVFFKDFWELLSSQFKLYRILRNGLLPINCYQESLEIFQFSNYLAIKK